MHHYDDDDNNNNNNNNDNNNNNNNYNNNNKEETKHLWNEYEYFAKCYISHTKFRRPTDTFKQCHKY